MTAAVADRSIAWFRKLLDNRNALRRSVRAAVVVPISFSIGSQVFGNAQTATFSAFGAFALLLFVDFPGIRQSRLAEFSLLGLTGVVFIVIGSYLARPSWLAVVSMAVVAFIVLFSGVVSSVTAAAGRAAILLYILPIMLPGTPASIPHRLLGWGIAFAIAVPVAIFVWPPQEQNQLRISAAGLCRALARMLQLEPPSPGEDDPRVAVSRSVKDLRAAFRASAARPVALSTGSRLLMRLVDDLEWLTTTVVNACADAPESWPMQGQRLRAAAATTMSASAHVLNHDGRGPTQEGCARLDDCIAALAKARRAVSDEALDELRGSSAARTGTPTRATPGEFDRPLYAAHELGYVVELTGVTVSAIAAADSRSWFARLIGRRPSGSPYGEAGAAERIASDHLDLSSVWLQNSVRGAAGLAAAVLLARITGQQEGFWIVLGALSVLRSNALSTGATVVRALIGTVIGFAIGGLIVGAIGTDPVILWILLPLAIFVAGFAPEAISFAAGQAGFTVMVIILFNIIAPAGWRIGVVRVEDIALGSAASLAAGVLFWPRGAGPAFGRVLAEAYESGATYLRESVDFLTGRRAAEPDVHTSAYSAFGRVDDAMRQYLAEHGAKNVSLESLTALSNGAGRLRLAGMAVTRLHTTLPAATDEGLAAPVYVLVDRTERVASWYSALGVALIGRAEHVPPVNPVAGEESFLDVVLPALDQRAEPEQAEQAEQAERLLWSGQYIGDVNRLRNELAAPAQDVLDVWGRPSWLR